MEIDKGCPQPLVFDGSILGEYICTIVPNKDGDWEPALKTGVSQRRCRVIFKSPWWKLSCDDDVWLREQATMNRVQIRLVDEQLEHIHNQSSYNYFGCNFAESKTLELRPASTHEMTGIIRSCVMDLRGAPTRDYEAIRQSLQVTPPFLVMMQHDDDSLNDEALRTLCTD